MDKLLVLVVTCDETYHPSLEDSFPGATVVRFGEDGAIEWLESNSCNLCVLDRPRVETVLRIRFRLPTSPIIAVGLQDPVLNDLVHPVASHRELRTMVARHLSAAGLSQPPQELRHGSLPPQLTVPHQLTEPTYQNWLRVIGYELDEARSTSLHLVQVEGGFVVRAVSRRTGQPCSMVFPDRDLPILAARAFAARGRRGRLRLGTLLLPTGYEDFLRALGRRLDETHVTTIRLVEEQDAIRVEGTRVTDDREGHRSVPFSERLGSEEIGVLLGEAFRHRFEQLPESGRSPESGA
jgi:hypothetical protein